MKGKIHCDSCHDEFHVPDVAAYHLKACLKCGAAPLISDDDLELVKVIDGLKELGLVTDDLSKAGLVEMRINTAGLRK